MFRLVRCLPGISCFGKYLYRINRELDERYHYCKEDQDMAQHTLKVCSTWINQRRVLIQKHGGNDLLLPSIIFRMQGSGQFWAAMVFFFEKVMLRKEQTE